MKYLPDMDLRDPATGKLFFELVNDCQYSLRNLSLQRFERMSFVPFKLKIFAQTLIRPFLRLVMRETFVWFVRSHISDMFASGPHSSFHPWLFFLSLSMETTFH